jgi:hypothetical protein
MSVRIYSTATNKDGPIAGRTVRVAIDGKDIPGLRNVKLSAAFDDVASLELDVLATEVEVEGEIKLTLNELHERASTVHLVCDDHGMMFTSAIPCMSCVRGLGAK